ncbi:TRAP transporter large permease [Pseudohalocynthiibacter aestuariivivens]|jgi:C4-dicarboxylate transporter, DctM subunit|uniref:TRAP transporter large permease protein n=1 Tax=Pseudohalocynthiibacter aestuariivivens TaxID=1591409 RepID=A0ABV5JE94_9RHOB|nr:MULTISPECIES: TRAP transporter large permease [Pseudohalocynthiibacter]MBS9718092.1 TRAP transporter large permease [Pseudohalocynthiibacter aestuariivivens]MCK0103303.1 TRAP transporter large permease [Pseudohalocynthiibacter sp. F2068]
MNGALALSLIIFFAVTIPVAVSIALASIFGIVFFSNLPLLVVPQKMFTGLDSFPLMAVPFFILAGNLMTKGGVSHRLVDFAKSLVGGTQGGLASTCVVACMVFAAISGSSVATTFAIGSILIPAMVKHGYPVNMAASIQASSSELGVIIPPSVPLILFAVSTQTSITQLFIAGIGPGLLIVCVLILMVQIWCRVKGYGKQDGDDKKSIISAFFRAFWALMMPVIILGGIYGGVFTPTEAAAVAVMYALFLGLIVYKEMKLSDLPELFKSAAMSSGAVMLIISAASLFSFLISLSGMPNVVGAWAHSTFEHAWSFLLAINILLFFVGMFIETAAAILVLAPILTPVAIAFGIDPVHFGIVIVVNLALGMFTPPLGVNLFAAAQVATIPVQNMFKSLVIPVFTMITALMIITYVPQVSLFLSDLMN